MTDEWVSTAEAAERLGVTAGHVVWLAQNEHLVGERHGHRWRVHRESLEQFAAERADRAATWVSYLQAAAIGGVSHHTIWRAVRSGELTSRNQSGSVHRSLRRAEVEAWGAARARHRDEAELRAADREAAAAARRAVTDPPEDGQVWLDVDTAALVLGMTPTGVRYRMKRGLLPHVRRGDRSWLRRDHVEQAAAARVFRRSST